MEVHSWGCLQFEDTLLSFGDWRRASRFLAFNRTSGPVQQGMPTLDEIAAGCNRRTRCAN